MTPLNFQCPMSRCRARPNEPCHNIAGFHWQRAKLAGWTPGELLAWARGDAEPEPEPRGSPPRPLGDDMALLGEIAETAIRMAEELGARGEEVARLRSIKNRLTGRTV